MLAIPGSLFSLRVSVIKPRCAAAIDIRSPVYAQVHWTHIRFREYVYVIKQRSETLCTFTVFDGYIHCLPFFISSLSLSSCLSCLTFAIFQVSLIMKNIHEICKGNKFELLGESFARAWGPSGARGDRCKLGVNL